MGTKSSSLLSNEQIEDFVVLTYLNKSEILYIFDKFSHLDYDLIRENIDYRFPKEWIVQIWPELKYNPFSNQIFRIFSSYNDNKFSFDDFLNLCSILSENCPLEVKAAWAFKLFDYNNDDIITNDDISNVIDRLTNPLKLFETEKEHITKILLKEMDLQEKGGMNRLEFVHAITKMPDFGHIFSFRP